MSDLLKPPLYDYLGRPMEREQMTSDQRAVLDATEMEIGMEMALGSGIPGEIGAMLEYMRGRGWWAKITTPFEDKPDQLYWAGFTPHSVSGWNGRPDHCVGDLTLRGALWRAVLLTLMSTKNGDPEATP